MIFFLFLSNSGQHSTSRRGVITYQCFRPGINLCFLPNCSGHWSLGRMESEEKTKSSRWPGNCHVGWQKYWLVGGSHDNGRYVLFNVIFGLFFGLFFGSHDKCEHVRTCQHVRKCRPGQGTGPPRQATGPPRQGAGVGVGMLRGDSKFWPQSPLFNQKNMN